MMIIAAGLTRWAFYKVCNMDRSKWRRISIVFIHSRSTFGLQVLQMITYVIRRIFGPAIRTLAPIFASLAARFCWYSTQCAVLFAFCFAFVSFFWMVAYYFLVPQVFFPYSLEFHNQKLGANSDLLGKSIADQGVSQLYQHGHAGSSFHSARRDPRLLYNHSPMEWNAPYYLQEPYHPPIPYYPPLHPAHVGVPNKNTDEGTPTAYVDMIHATPSNWLAGKYASPPRNEAVKSASPGRFRLFAANNGYGDQDDFDSRILQANQEYKVHLYIDVPDTYHNRRVGVNGITVVVDLLTLLPLNSQNSDYESYYNQRDSSDMYYEPVHNMMSNEVSNKHRRRVELLRPMDTHHSSNIAIRKVKETSDAILHQRSSDMDILSADDVQHRSARRLSQEQYPDLKQDVEEVYLDPVNFDQLFFTADMTGARVNREHFDIESRVSYESSVQSMASDPTLNSIPPTEINDGVPNPTPEVIRQNTARPESRVGLQRVDSTPIHRQHPEIKTQRQLQVDGSQHTVLARCSKRVFLPPPPRRGFFSFLYDLLTFPIRIFSSVLNFLSKVASPHPIYAGYGPYPYEPVLESVDPSSYHRLPLQCFEGFRESQEHPVVGIRVRLLDQIHIANGGIEFTAEMGGISWLLTGGMAASLPIVGKYFEHSPLYTSSSSLIGKFLIYLQNTRIGLYVRVIFVALTGITLLSSALFLFLVLIFGLIRYYLGGGVGSGIPFPGFLDPFVIVQDVSYSLLPPLEPETRALPPPPFRANKNKKSSLFSGRHQKSISERKKNRLDDSPSLFSVGDDSMNKRSPEHASSSRNNHYGIFSSALSIAKKKAKRNLSPPMSGESGDPDSENSLSDHDDSFFRRNLHTSSRVSRQASRKPLNFQMLLRQSEERDRARMLESKALQTLESCTQNPPTSNDEPLSNAANTSMKTDDASYERVSNEQSTHLSPRFRPSDLIGPFTSNEEEEAIFSLGSNSTVPPTEQQHEDNVLDLNTEALDSISKVFDGSNNINTHRSFAPGASNLLPMTFSAGEEALDHMDQLDEDDSTKLTLATEMIRPELPIRRTDEPGANGASAQIDQGLDKQNDRDSDNEDECEGAKESSAFEAHNENDSPSPTVVGPNRVESTYFCALEVPSTHLSELPCVFEDTNKSPTEVRSLDSKSSIARILSPEMATIETLMNSEALPANDESEANLPTGHLGVHQLVFGPSVHLTETNDLLTTVSADKTACDAVIIGHDLEVTSSEGNREGKEVPIFDENNNHVGTIDFDRAYDSSDEDGPPIDTSTSLPMDYSPPLVRDEYSVYDRENTAGVDQSISPSCPGGDLESIPSRDSVALGSPPQSGYRVAHQKEDLDRELQRVFGSDSLSSATSSNLAGSEFPSVSTPRTNALLSPVQTIIEATPFVESESEENIEQDKNDFSAELMNGQRVGGIHKSNNLSSKKVLKTTSTYAPLPLSVPSSPYLSDSGYDTDSYLTKLAYPKDPDHPF